MKDRRLPRAVGASRCRFSLALPWILLTAALLALVQCNVGFYWSGKVLARTLTGDPGWDPTGINGPAYTPDPSLPRLGLILFVGSRANEKMSWMWRLSYHNKLHYARRHRYDLIVENEELSDALYDTSSPRSSGRPNGSRPLCFGKIAALRKWLPKYQWLMWIDADTVIHRLDVPASSFIDDTVDVVMSRDWMSINSGVFLIRNSPYGRRLLAEVWDADRKWWRVHCEQDALRHVVEETIYFAQHNEHWSYPPQRLFNAFSNLIATGEPHSTYQRGDFLIHFPNCLGLGASTCRREFERHYNEACRRNGIDPTAVDREFPDPIGGFPNQSWFDSAPRTQPALGPS